mmetsp:Transcript_33250/g.60258  ORF Transcript_33250/g.60258 Transcript_33250/m.60258 type:complete len:760 (+) Transcript_33250:42-2321(+)|eukprot:CAMPEP_0197626642 /NCGR_PEP_ID=MMETSP1338-20131121/5508_1 /TAXON_ID=43686 ORGANISM="Pelagodinium beii, Strain RCC1491" /NCGR_SAMPLE_ID=MMETSP1338 /ASSEMBLY_ACC=CAM_ASM_000754 /LENGTH=759 /DNA_ID=CAMNT_0043197191 /DNA_START=25 /DNA_END=2304 /DNA_ORIENTATION=+
MGAREKLPAGSSENNEGDEVEVYELMEDKPFSKSGSLWQFTEIGMRSPGKSASVTLKNYDFIMSVRQAITERVDMSWTKILASSEGTLGPLFEVSENSGECLACAVADPQLPDCPLIYISKQFEQLTGYFREWVIGRNCRFLQPKRKEVNVYYNRTECMLMREFCTGVKEIGSRIVTLLLNESASDIPFWNLLLMEHVEVAGQPFILGVQTNLEHESAKLAEIIVQSTERLEELERLRTIFRSQHEKLGELSMHGFATHCINMWARDFPVALTMPSLPMEVQSRSQATGKDERGGSLKLPLAGLQLTKDSNYYEAVTKALQEGIRHFYVLVPGSSPSGVRLQHPGATAADRHIMILRLAAFAHDLKEKLYHYVGRAVSFSIVTDPSSLDAFSPIQKILSSNGYTIHAWLLDSTRIRPEVLESCWKAMTAAHAAGDVKALGCLGASAKVLEMWREVCRGGAPLNLWAMEMYQGKITDAWDESHHRQLMHKLSQMGTQCIGFNILGPKSSLLEDENFTDAADHAQLDPMMFAIKCAEAQGWGVLLPQLRIEADSDEDLEESVESEGANLKFHNNFADTYQSARSAQACLRIFKESTRIVRRRSAVVNSLGSGVTPGASRRQSLPTSPANTFRPTSPGNTSSRDGGRRQSFPAIPSLTSKLEEPPRPKRSSVKEATSLRGLKEANRRGSPEVVSRRGSTELPDDTSHMTAIGAQEKAPAWMQIQPTPPMLARPTKENPRHRKGSIEQVREFTSKISSLAMGA